MRPLRLVTLGHPKLLDVRGEPINLGRKDLSLVAFVALQRREVTRAELADTFWADRASHNARQSLRQSLTHLRAVLGDVLETGQLVSASTQGLSVDVTELQAAIRDGRYEDAFSLYAGDFLADYEDVAGDVFRTWLEQERTAVRKRVEWVLGQLVDQARKNGAQAAAGAWSLQLSKLLPYDERVHVTAMRLLRDAGQEADALAVGADFERRVNEERGESVSQGFLDVVEAIRVQPAKQVRSASMVFTPDFIGREKEMADLASKWRTAVRGSGESVWITGDLGIGKSRLCVEFISWLETQKPGALVLRVNGKAAHAQDNGVARMLLAPLNDARGLLGASPEALAQLSRVIPAVRIRLSLPVVEATTPALIAGVRQVLEAVAAENPVLIVVDDLGDADEGSIALIKGIAFEPPPGVLILLSDCGEEFSTGGSRITSADPVGSKIRLRTLDVVHTQKMLLSMLALRPETASNLAAQLHAQTGGNPLFIVEVINGLLEEDYIAPDEQGIWKPSPSVIRGVFPIPATILEVVRKRVNSLGPSASRVLSAAAVTGSVFHVEAVQNQVALPDFEFNAGVSELIEARMIRETFDGSGRFEFSQDLIRRVMHERRDFQQPGAELGVADADASPMATRRPLSGLGNAVRRRWRTLVGIAVAALVIAAGVVTTGRKATPALDSSRVAVMPFALRGPEQNGYLREAFPQLIAIAMDGAASLTTVDPNVLFAVAVSNDASTSHLSADSAQRIARHFGAGRYVLGDVSISGPRMRVTATLYSASGSAAALAQVSAEGGESDIFQTADRLASQLIAGQFDTSDATVRVATSTTNSLPALKAYLAGERAYREGRFNESANSYLAAVTEDSTYALAYWRLVEAAEWALREDLTSIGVAGSHRFQTRLPERQRLLSQAREIERYNTSKAEHSYRAIIAMYPDDVDAWFRLAELQFHQGPVQGRRVQESAPAFRRTLSLLPAHAGAILHLARIAAADSNKTAFDEVFRRAQRANSGPKVFTELAALRAFRFEGAPEQKRLINSVRTLGDEDLIVLGRVMVVFARNLQATQDLLGLLVEPTRSPLARGHGFQLIAELEMTRGRLQAMEANLRQIAPLDSAREAEARAMNFVHSVRRPDRASLERARANRLAHIGPDTFPGWLRAHSQSEADARSQAALLSARLGDSAGMVRYLGSAKGAVDNRFRKSVMALYLFDMGKWQEVTSTLSDTTIDLGVHSAFYTVERFLRAESLFRSGRRAEAERWYASMPEFWGSDIPYFPIAQLRLGEIYEASGRRKEAISAYERYVSLMDESDPEFRPLLNAAKKRLEALR